MARHLIQLSERDVKEIIRQYYLNKEGHLVEGIQVSYDRPPNPTPLDPGEGLTITVTLRDEVQHGA